jgi:hypothetical protein
MMFPERETNDSGSWSFNSLIEPLRIKEYTQRVKRIGEITPKISNNRGDGTNLKLYSKPAARCNIRLNEKEKPVLTKFSVQ